LHFCESEDNPFINSTYHRLNYSVELCIPVYL
jgi:hypothetical protein